jgi:hypothetical protein
MKKTGPKAGFAIGSSKVLPGIQREMRPTKPLIHRRHNMGLLLQLFCFGVSIFIRGHLANKIAICIIKRCLGNYVTIRTERLSFHPIPTTCIANKDMLRPFDISCGRWLFLRTSCNHHQLPLFPSQLAKPLQELFILPFQCRESLL